MPEITRTLAALIDQVDGRTMHRLARTWKDDGIPTTRRPAMKRYLLYSDRVTWSNLLPCLRVEQLRAACQSLRAPYGGPRFDLENSLRIEATIDDLDLKPFSNKGKRVRKFLWESACSDNELPTDELIQRVQAVIHGEEPPPVQAPRPQPATSPRTRPARPKAAQHGLAAVAGMETLKGQLQDEVIGPLKHASRYRRYGLTIPSGVLFHGPPGCGKTYLAERLAEELKLELVRVLPSTVGSALVHETASRISELFAKARTKKNALLFFDELDALAPNRAHLDGTSDYKAEEVNELLAQLNDAGEHGILVLGATNLKSRLDPALLRPGRFDTHIHIGPPDAPTRRAILEYHLTNRPLADLDLAPIVQRTQGRTASDLKRLVNQAALLALKQDDPITTWHLEQALQTQRRLV